MIRITRNVQQNLTVLVAFTRKEKRKNRSALVDIVYSLIIRKVRVRFHDQASKRNMKKFLFFSSNYSQEISDKNSESKLTCYEKVFQKICHSDSMVNCRSRH